MWTRAGSVLMNSWNLIIHYFYTSEKYEAQRAIWSIPSRVYWLLKSDNNYNQWNICSGLKVFHWVHILPKLLTTNDVTLVVFQYHCESRNSGTTHVWIFFKMNRMMLYWAQKISSKFKVHLSFRLAEMKNYSVI